jgi:uncharacterized protein
MSRYPELVDKVDAFFARVHQRHGADMQCGSGCHDCCHVRLSIAGVEAQAIRDELATWPPERKQLLTANVATAAPDRCAALDRDGWCLIYAARPLVCRSHGAPIRMTVRSLRVIRACERNFTTTSPDADCVIDQQTLSAMLLAVDRDAGRDGSRIDLAELLADC